MALPDNEPRSSAAADAPARWERIDWTALDRLREGFIGGGATRGPYWTSGSDLESYDLTFGERIGWKWDAVLAEVKMRGWSPVRNGPILDWGCGSGVAGRRVLQAFGTEGWDGLLLWDHSPEACSFAAEAAGRSFPNLSVAMAARGFLESDAPIGLLVVSHVLNELDAGARETLLALTARARAILWVEPGDRETSRALGAVRDRLAGSFRIAAPCTRAGPCPILEAGNERHWCHHFAPPPPWIFTDGNWVRFGKRAGIDLRSLPYSFVVLDRVGGRVADPVSSPVSARDGSAGGLSRVIGRPEGFKPYTRVLNCDADGLRVLTVAKRDAPDLIKALDRTRGPLVYRWRWDGDRIVGGDRPDGRE